LRPGSAADPRSHACGKSFSSRSSRPSFANFAVQAFAQCVPVAGKKTYNRCSFLTHHESHGSRTQGDPFTRPLRRNAGCTRLARQLELRFLCFSKSFSSRSGWMLDVTRAVGQLHRKQFVKSRSDLEALGFQQHASDIVVLGRVADEQIHFSHEVPEQFGGFDQFPRFKRAEQASLAVFFLAGIFSFY
jgi:hypothetical protein